MKLIRNRMVGGILLVSGTTIGAGMLALPISTAAAGFFPSITLLFICWVFMLASAFFFLDVNLAIRGEPNLISMAGKTLGVVGKAISWCFYLLLLYSLTAAYIAGSSSLFIEGIKSLTGWQLSHQASFFCLPILFGGFVYLGTLGVDYINRVLMFGLAVAYFMLIGFVGSSTKAEFLSYHNWPSIFVGVTVVITSFGYHIIIPSLTTYMNHDAKNLRWTLLIGSIIPFLIYVFWQYLIMGSLPLEQMLSAWERGEAATAPLARLVENTTVIVIAQFFSFFAIVTSFLGVTLSLSDFLTDGFRIKKSWEGKLLACGLTFLPPLVFVFSYERGFYLALQYAGAFVAILLILLPALMAWKLKGHPLYRTLKGKTLLICVMLFAIFVIVEDIFKVTSFFE